MKLIVVHEGPNPIGCPFDGETPINKSMPGVWDGYGITAYVCPKCGTYKSSLVEWNTRYQQEVGVADVQI